VLSRGDDPPEPPAWLPHLLGTRRWPGARRCPVSRGLVLALAGSRARLSCCFPSLTCCSWGCSSLAWFGCQFRRLTAALGDARDGRVLLLFRSLSRFAWDACCWLGSLWCGFGRATGASGVPGVPRGSLNVTRAPRGLTLVGTGSSVGLGVTRATPGKGVTIATGVASPGPVFQDLHNVFSRRLCRGSVGALGRVREW